MKVGIIIPVLNNLKYLRALVPTVLSQEHELSFFIIDNGSTDPTEEYLTQQSRIRPRFHFEIHDRPLGVAAAWNRGVRAALAAGMDLVYVLNSDLLLHPQTIDHLARYYLSNDFDIVCSPDIRFVPEIGFHHALPAAPNPGEIEVAYQALCSVRIPRIEHGRHQQTDQHQHPTLFAFLFAPKALTERVGWFDESLVKCYFEDVDYCWRLILSGGDVSVSRESPVLHFENRGIHEGGVTLEHWQRNHDYFMAKHQTTTTSLEETYRRRSQGRSSLLVRSSADPRHPGTTIRTLLLSAVRASATVPVSILEALHQIEPRSPGFNVFAFASGNFGLATAARNTLELLAAKGCPFRVWDVTTGDSRSGQVQSIPASRSAASWHLPHTVNLFHLNPHEMQLLLPSQFPALALERRLNVAVPFWELPILPERWIAMLDAMDVILAPTRFIQDAILRALPHKAVRHFPQAARLPDQIRPDRARFDLPPDTVVFLCAFDMASDIQRKNPVGAIHAFQLAFPTRTDVRLVIKVNNPDLAPEYSRSTEHLRQLAAADSRIRLLDRRLGRAETLTLFASCDVLVSLHRSEGLGLVLMECMALGRPVIATAWSGVMDFVTASNACLVPYDLVPIVASMPEYQYLAPRPGAVWAEPRLEDAARAMRDLAEDPNLRNQLGRQAAVDMAARSQLDRDQVFDELLKHPDAASDRPVEERSRHPLRLLRLDEIQRRHDRHLRQLVREPGLLRRLAGRARDRMSRYLREQFRRP